MRLNPPVTGRTPKRALAALGIAALILAAGLGIGCHGSSSSDEAAHVTEFSITTTSTVTQTTVAPTTSTTAPRKIPTPVSVKVPSVGIASNLIPLGLNPDRTLEVPKDFALAGWYTGRPVPGEPGPSVIAGHVDSKSGPAVFYRLRDIQPGALVDVTRSDGTVARFKVVAKEQHEKDEFPTEHVYGPTTDPELRLITCGGDFNRSIGHYDDNIVVFAQLVDIT